MQLAICNIRFKELLIINYKLLIKKCHLKKKIVQEHLSHKLQ
jgi:hypothetical protein